MNHKNYYEVLGVAPHVGSGQIQAAYRFARSLYSGESIPTYGVLNLEERTQMLALVEEAYTALSNPNVRRDYDTHMGAAGAMAPAAVERGPWQPPPGLPDKARHPRPAPTAPPPVVEASAEVIRVPDLVNGSVLKSLRESRGLSIDQIAALSKIGSRFLKALEEDRHEALPGRVFARGFLIEYARAIRAPENEIVDRYLRHWTAR